MLLFPAYLKVIRRLFYHPFLQGQAIWAFVRWLEFGVPAQILIVIALLLERKDKK